MRKAHGLEYAYLKRKLESTAHKLAGRRRIRGRARFHAANASTGTQEPFRWLLDTGSGIDLMSKKKLSNDDKKHVHWATSIITLLTANGKKQVDKAVKMMCSAMHEVIDPLLLDDTPPVLSIGRRCEKYGYQFHWDAYSNKPYLVKPNGDVIVLYTENYVPFLDQEESKSDPNNYTGVIAPSIVRYCIFTNAHQRWKQQETKHKHPCSAS